MSDSSFSQDGINEKDIEFLMAVWAFVDTESKKRLDKIIIKLQKQLGIKPDEALP